MESKQNEYWASLLYLYFSVSITRSQKDSTHTGHTVTYFATLFSLSTWIFKEHPFDDSILLFCVQLTWHMGFGLQCACNFVENCNFFLLFLLSLSTKVDRNIETRANMNSVNFFSKFYKCDEHKTIAVFFFCSTRIRWNAVSVFQGRILLNKFYRYLWTKSKWKEHGEKKVPHTFIYHGILLPVARFTFIELTAVKCHSSIQL